MSCSEFESVIVFDFVFLFMSESTSVDDEVKVDVGCCVAVVCVRSETNDGDATPSGALCMNVHSVDSTVVGDKCSTAMMNTTDAS